MDELSKMRLLAHKWLNGTISEEEKEEFEAWYNSQPGNELPWTKDASEEELRQRMLAVLMEKIDTEEHPVIAMPSRKRTVRRLALAASVIIAVAAGSYFIFFNKQSGKEAPSIANSKPIRDVTPPTATHAVITLANGRQVEINNIANGLVAQAGSVNIVKLADGQIAYQAVTTNDAPIEYNTFSNPRGSKAIDFTLTDGTHIWLNSESSVRYPTRFTGNERKVEITGEAYFEVAHDASKPFKVSKGETEVTVLGTHFNVNSYNDEEAMKVTLLEGSVRVRSEVGSQKSEKIIKPGQQARVVNGELSVMNDVDIDGVMAWKNGLFKFDRADIATVMRQIARWYDVDVEYSGKVNQHFGGTISRQVNASKVFELLEMTGGVKFRVEGKKVVVMP